MTAATNINLPPLPNVVSVFTDHPWFSKDQMLAFATAAVLAERQRCERLCLQVIDESKLGTGHAVGAGKCMHLIRSSGEQP